MCCVLTMIKSSHTSGDDCSLKSRFAASFNTAALSRGNCSRSRPSLKKMPNACRELPRAPTTDSAKPPNGTCRDGSAVRRFLM